MDKDHKTASTAFHRRPNRLRDFDYTSNGIYFITICERNHACRFGEIIDGERGAAVRLTSTGAIIAEAIARLPNVFPEVRIDHSVVMPNHVHLLMRLRGAAKPVPSIVNYFKGHVSRRVGERIWQKSFHDHIVRDERDYRRIWEYIDCNPGKWREDRYYCP